MIFVCRYQRWKYWHSSLFGATTLFGHQRKKGQSTNISHTFNKSYTLLRAVLTAKTTAGTTPCQIEINLKKLTTVGQTKDEFGLAIWNRLVCSESSYSKINVVRDIRSRRIHEH